MRSTLRLLAVASAAALVLAACDTDTTGDPTGDEPDAEPTEDVDDPDDVDDTDTDDTADASEDGEVADDDTDATDDAAAVDDGADLQGVELLTLTESRYGEHLGDRDGITVYAYILDDIEEGPPTCTGDCSVVWSPVQAPAEGPEVGDGVDAELVGTVEREDAAVVGFSHQLTYAGHPLYTFTSDQEPGDARGQELARSWFAIGADGELIGDVPDDDEVDEMDLDEGADDEDDEGDEGEEDDDGDE